jgi:uncharacterized protein YdaU (DUF1376 family)
MHYYQFNIGDYASHTRNLSLLEDLAYRRLLDEYYLHERPFNECITTVARQIGMREHEDAVGFILQSFFVLQKDGWVNKRAEEELAKFRSKSEQASKAGKASAERRLNGRSTDVQPTNNHKPITNNQEPIINTTRQKAISCPQGVSEDVWRDFCQHRKSVRATVTQTALDGIEREAKKAGWSLEAALRECVLRGWRGFKADWVNKPVTAKQDAEAKKQELADAIWGRRKDDGRTIEAVTPRLG